MDNGLTIRDKRNLDRQIAHLERVEQITLRQISDNQRLIFQRRADLLHRSYVAYAKSLGRQKAWTMIRSDVYRRTYMNTSCARSPDETFDLWRLIKTGYQPKSWRFALEFERQKTVEMVAGIDARNSQKNLNARGPESFHFLTLCDDVIDDETTSTDSAPGKVTDNQGGMGESRDRKKANNTKNGDRMKTGNGDHTSGETSVSAAIAFERCVSVPAITKQLRKRIEPSLLRRRSAPSPLSHRDHGSKLGTKSAVEAVIPGDMYKPTVPVRAVSNARVPRQRMVLQKRQAGTRRELTMPERNPDRTWLSSQPCDPDDPSYWTEKERQEKIFRPRIVEFFRHIEPLHTGNYQVELEHEVPQIRRNHDPAKEDLPHVALSESRGLTDATSAIRALSL